MMVTVIIAAILILAVSWYVLFRIRHRKLYELAGKLPGPPQLPITGHLHRFMGDTEDIMTSLKEFSYLANHEGGVVKGWFGPLLFCMLTDPVDIEYVLKTYLDKDEKFAKIFRRTTGNGMEFAPVSIWQRRRKIAAPAFAMKHLTQFVEVFSEQSTIMMKQFQQQVGVASFDPFPYFTSYTLKSIFEVALGIDTKARTDDFALLMDIMSRLLNILCKRIFYPWLHPECLFGLSPSYQTHRKCLLSAHAFIDDAIRDAKRQIRNKQKLPTLGEECTQPKPILSFLMEPQNKGTGYDDLELREEITLLSIAATDTLSVGTCFTLMLLGQYQDVQDKVYNELEDVFGTSGRPPLKEDLPKLCYLEQVIKESLRLYPPVPFISRHADRDVALPSGKVLPAGCGIPISIWGVHRNPKYWGSDAEQFQPDRFSPERFNPQHPCVYIPFSAGPRNCIGYQYALMCMKTSLATVLRKYRVRVPAGSSQQIRVKFEIMMKPVNGFTIQLEQRN